ncbi:Uncharacterised protein [Mycobacteroides abscessus subsp. abscessus]|nr:Uncharacterised protein [Mycobacteroides abscessus subsp. abscessus]
MMVVTADSSTMSLMPAVSVLPIGDSGSIWMSMCKPLCFNRIEVGLAGSPW